MELEEGDIEVLGGNGGASAITADLGDLVFATHVAEGEAVEVGVVRDGEEEPARQGVTAADAADADFGDVVVVDVVAEGDVSRALVGAVAEYETEGGAWGEGADEFAVVLDFNFDCDADTRAGGPVVFVDWDVDDDVFDINDVAELWVCDGLVDAVSAGGRCGGTVGLVVAVIIAVAVISDI